MASNKKILILICLLIWPAFSLAQTTSPWTDRLAPLKTGWQQMQAKRAVSYGQMMVQNLLFSQERSQGIYNSVLEKVEEEASSSQKTLLMEKVTEIKTILDRNQAEIDKLKVSLKPQNATNVSWQETKRLVRSIIKDLRLTHKKIKEALKLLG